MQSVGNRTVNATGRRVVVIQVLEIMSEVVKCEWSNRTEKKNVDLERSTFFNPRNLMPLEKRMDLRLTVQI